MSKHETTHRFTFLDKAENHIEFCKMVETAQQRVQWAYESLHLSQAGFIRLFIDLGLHGFLGELKSASTIKAYLQGNIPKSAPESFDNLIVAIACLFNLNPADFYDTALHRKDFNQKVLAMFSHQAVFQHGVVTKTDGDDRSRAALPEEKRIEPIQEKTGGRPDTDVAAAIAFPAKRRLSARSIGLIVSAFCLIWFAASILTQGGGTTDPYPACQAPEVRTATLDGRDLWLNSAATPMLVAYGSKLCVVLASTDLHASVFVEDRGFYFNQEGRLLFQPSQSGERCTGIWPGLPDSFHKTTYKLYILTSKQKIPVTGDSDRLDNLPSGSYFGPVYLQRTE